jgi:hypothetical protein
VKKFVLSLITPLVISASAWGAVRWEVGLGAGLRTIKDETLRSTYGQGFVYTPYVNYRVSRTLWVGLEYEGGFVKKARIGIFQEESRLAVEGVQAYVLYGKEKGAIRPFVKVGAGSFHFEMDIDSPYVQAYNFASSDISILFGAGLKVMLSRKLFLSGELKYTALWADPFDDLVDLGGLRLLLGVGIQI